jgi:uncharacterized protein (TIGR02117 family)
MNSFFYLIPFLILSCVGPVEKLYPPLESTKSHTIYVVNHGWHTGIIIDRQQAESRLVALKSEFLRDRYLEIGWGDAEFYQSGGNNSSYGFSALFWPTDSVMHVVGFSKAPKTNFLFSELIELKISETGFRNLLEFINNSFTLSDKGIPLKITPGLYGRSWFFKSTHSYHMFFTCNHWSAEAIRKTGFPISTFYAVTAGNIMFQLKRGAQ